MATRNAKSGQGSYGAGTIVRTRRVLVAAADNAPAFISPPPTCALAEGSCSWQRNAAGRTDSAASSNALSSRFLAQLHASRSLVFDAPIWRRDRLLSRRRGAASTASDGLPLAWHCALV